VKPHLAAEISPELAQRARDLARRIRDSPHPRELRREGAAIVLELTEAGLASFFLHPVEELALGFVATSTTRLGLKTAAGGIALFVRRLVDGMSDEQLRGVAASVDRLLVDLDDDGAADDGEDRTARA
jgi:hypothetical protein